MRATLLASAISMGSVSVSMAFPVALQPTAAEAVRIHGCHHAYGRDWLASSRPGLPETS